MILTYETIKYNLETYKQAREQFSLIRDYEDGKTTLQNLRIFGLGDFGEFYEFCKKTTNSGIEPVMFITFKDLKTKIVEKTRTARLAKLFSNKTQPKFKKMIMEDGESFDKLMNGRWMRKPTYRRNGRMSYGTRSNESVEGIRLCFIELINWLIINQVPVYEKSTKDYDSFLSQESNIIRWYTSKRLNWDNVPIREMNITNEMMSSFIDSIDKSKIDFRKLNSDFIISSLQDKVRSLMHVPVGTMVKCLVDKTNDYGKSLLIKDKSYRVEGSTIQSGFLKVVVIDERGSSNYFPYSYFEDMQILRNDLLDQLFS
jgi:hypothetical protein